MTSLLWSVLMSPSLRFVVFSYRMMSIKKVFSSQHDYSSRLFLVNFNDIVIFHLELLRRVCVIDSSAVEQKPKWGHRNSLVKETVNKLLNIKHVKTYHSLRVGLLQFSHGSCHLDPEVDFISILAYNLQFDILSVLSCVCLGFLSRCQLLDVKLHHKDLHCCLPWLMTSDVWLKNSVVITGVLWPQTSMSSERS